MPRQSLRQIFGGSASGLCRAGALREHGAPLGELALLHVADPDELVKVLEGDLYDLRIEVVPALLPDELEDFVERPGLLVAPVGAERVEHVGKGGDASVERDLLALETERVSCAVPFLVMIAGDDAGVHEERKSLPCFAFVSV